MDPRVTPIDATLGAVVSGLTLSQMDASTWKTVERAFHDHAVLVFPAQHLTEDEQVAFANRFGDIELLAPDPEQKAVAISNQKPDGTVMNADEHRYKSLRGNEGWHTDSSYMPLAAKASVLSAQVVPSADGETGGPTCGRPTMRSTRRCAGASRGCRLTTPSITPRPGLVTWSRREPPTVFTPRGAAAPLVKVHPVTGRPALFIGRHAYGIPGLGEAESESSYPISSTSPVARPEPMRIGGVRATWSSGTTAAYCTGLVRTTTASRG